MNEENEKSMKDILAQALLALLVVYIGIKILVFFFQAIKNRQVMGLARDVIIQRNQNIYDFKTRSDIDVQEILKLDVEGLRAELASGKVTSVDLVNIYGQRCQTIGRVLCLSAEENFEQAFELARKCDKERENARSEGTLEDLPLFHGVPISVKDLINQKGKLSTIGCAFKCTDSHRAEEDGLPVKLLLKAGAIPIVRGSCPQTALSLDTNNLIFGQARNPIKQNRSVGGSSGGDAGLVLSRCVPFGVGSDIGGSLRFPASFCGIYGFKPTQNRLTKAGCGVANKDNFNMHKHLTATIGPMGTSTSDLISCMKVLSDPNVHLFDSEAVPLPWNEEKHQEALNGKVRIGILKESSFLPCSDSVKRAMNLTETALTELGYEVVPFSFDETTWRQAFDFYMGMVCNGGALRTIADMEAECETLLAPLEKNITILMAGAIKRYLIEKALLSQKKGRLVRSLKHVKVLDQSQLNLLLKQKQEWVKGLAKMWQDAGLTALITPFWPHCAPRITDVGDQGLMAEYSFIWNVTGFPAGIVPVTRVLESEQTFTDDWKDNYTELLNSNCSGSEDMPICVQVVGYSYQDEHVLAVMKALEDKIQFDMNVPEVDLRPLEQQKGSGLQAYRGANSLRMPSAVGGLRMSKLNMSKVDATIETKQLVEN